MERDARLKALGQHIRQVRKSRGLSQAELGHLMGKDQQAIQRLESGRVNPTYLFLSEVADSLNMPLHELLDLPIPDAGQADR